MKDSKILVWDIEANGLLNTVDKVHCLVAKDIITETIVKLYNDTLTRENIISLFRKTKLNICHNQIGYDLDILKRFYNIDLNEIIGREAILDTFIWSRVLNPDRELPSGCPTTMRNPVTKETKKVGPHGLESWGYRAGKKKPEINDWRYFNEEMLNRCTEDVLINEQAYYLMCKEAKINPITWEEL